MGAQHTPGPWSFRDDQEKRFAISSSDGRIAWTAITPSSARREEGAANARLIAAAPELLEALKFLLKCTLNTADKDEDPEEWLVVKSMRAAIQKATQEGEV